MDRSIRYLLVDGHSVIHHWPALRSLHRRQPRRARDELRASLEKLHDSSDWRITLVFDGKTGPNDPNADPRSMRVLYSEDGQTADSIIERIVGQQEDRSRITVVTADEAERQTIEAMGAFTASPLWLATELNQGLEDLTRTLDRLHRREKW
jgi:predicted RNA-binding protein with PIN domain